MRVKIYRTNLIFLFLAWLFLSLIAGFRWLGIDRDYYSYLYFYEALNPSLIDSFLQTRFEPAFVLLAWMSSFIFSIDFSIFLLLCAFISLGIKFYLFSLLERTWIVLFFYILILFPVHEMTQIRAAISIAFLYLSFEFLLNDKKRLAITLFLVGVLFHYSILYFSPIFFLKKKLLITEKLISRKIVLLLCLVCLGFFFVFYFLELFIGIASYLNPFTNIYVFDSENEFNLFSSRSITFFILSVIGVLAYSSSPDKAKMYMLISLYGMTSMALGIFVPGFGHRTFEITILSCILWLGLIPRKYFIPASIVLTPFALYSLYSLTEKGFFYD